MRWSCCCLVMTEIESFVFPEDTVRELPSAFGGAPLTGCLRASPEDFRVEEILGYQLTAAGEHLVLKIEKRGLNTRDVAAAIARWAGVKPVAVGFAGLKDRIAVATQHFSVALPGDHPDPNALQQENALRVLAVSRHRRKLRRGELAGNRFALTLTDVSGDRGQAEEILERMRAMGFPNYFGPQRFGRRSSNLVRAQALLTGRLKRPKPEQRRMLLSAARSHVFNQVLAARVRAHIWCTALPGEVLLRAIDGQQLLAPRVAPALTERVNAGELDPSGPLPGRRGRCLVPEGGAQDFETRWLAELGLEPWIQALADLGLHADRRSLRARPRNLEWAWGGERTLALGFELPSGSYATSLVRELMSTELARQ